MNPLERYLIYLLRDPRNCEPRYVGKSVSGIHRPRSHLVNPNPKQAYLYNWIHSLQAGGLEAEILIVERFSKPEYLAEAERYWIKTLREAGYRLTNLTDGGEGRLGLRHPEEAKQKIRETKQKRRAKADIEGGIYGMYGRSHTLQAKDKIAAASIGRLLSDSTKQRLSQIRKGTATRGSGWHHSEEIRKQQSERMQGNKRGAGAVFSDERRNKISKALTGIVRSEETRRKISESKKAKTMYERD